MYTFNTHEIEEQIIDAISATSAQPSGNISLHIDGAIHRYKVEGDRGSEESGSGAYCIWTDNWPCGWFRNWRTGEHVTWFFNREKLNDEGKSYFTDDKYQELLEKAKLAQAKIQEELKQKQLAASDLARSTFSALIPAPEDHPYLVSKNVPSYGLCYRKDTRQLAVPLKNIKGDIQSLQWIDSNGEKRFFEHAATKGVFFSIGLDLLKYEQYSKNPILVGEGYATMATVYELTGYPSVAAMTCGNLHEVAKVLKEKYPKQTIIFVADNDHHTEGNPGLTHARQANEALGLNGIISPKFKHAERGTDWNDYCQIHGADQTAARDIHTHTGQEDASPAPKSELHKRGRFAPGRI